MKSFLSILVLVLACTNAFASLCDDNLQEWRCVALDNDSVYSVKFTTDGIDVYLRRDELGVKVQAKELEVKHAQTETMEIYYDANQKKVLVSTYKYIQGCGGGGKLNTNGEIIDRYKEKLYDLPEYARGMFQNYYLDLPASNINKKKVRITYRACLK